MSLHETNLPKWREDFPYEVEADEHITRRDFTRFLLLVSAGLAAGNGFVWVTSRRQSGESFPALSICRISEMASGSARLFNYPDESEPAILIRRENGELIAFQQKCTHLSCPVMYRASTEDDSEHLVCHCHHGRFDVSTGEGQAGPPLGQRPLRRVELQVDGDEIVAVGLCELRRPGGGA